MQEDKKYLLLFLDDYTENELKNIEDLLNKCDDIDVKKINDELFYNFIDNTSHLFTKKYNLIISNRNNSKIINRFNRIHKNYKPFFLKTNFETNDIENAFKTDTEKYNDFNIDFFLTKEEIKKVKDDIFRYDFLLNYDEIAQIIEDKTIYFLFRDIKDNIYVDKNEKYVRIENLLRSYNLKINKVSFRPYYMVIRYNLLYTNNRKRKPYANVFDDIIFSYYIDKNIDKETYLNKIENFKNTVLHETSKKEQININKIIDFVKSSNSDILKNKIQEAINTYNNSCDKKTFYYSEEDFDNLDICFFDANYILSIYYAKKNIK